MAILRSRTTTANKALTQYKDDLDAGSGPGTAKIYSGAIPASPDAAATGTLLAELVLTKPCGVVADKKLTFSACIRTPASYLVLRKQNQIHTVTRLNALVCVGPNPRQQVVRVRS